MSEAVAGGAAWAGSDRLRADRSGSRDARRATPWRPAAGVRGQSARAGVFVDLEAEQMRRGAAGRQAPGQDLTRLREKFATQALRIEPTQAGGCWQDSGTHDTSSVCILQKLSGK